MKTPLNCFLSATLATVLFAASLSSSEAFGVNCIPRRSVAVDTALHNFFPGSGGSATWQSKKGGGGAKSYSSGIGGGGTAFAPSYQDPGENFAAVPAELKLLMDNPSWDDGSLAPILIRLAWHSSGAYDASSNTGGSNGAGMRFGTTEANDPENAGIGIARAFLEPVKNKFGSGISYSDLWVLAAYVGIEHTGGPSIEFQGGRVDHVDDSYYSYWNAKGMTYGRLPAAEKYLCPHIEGTMVGESLDETGKVKGWEGLCSHVRNEVFYRMGFNDQEIVALLCGGHAAIQSSLAMLDHGSNIRHSFRMNMRPI